MPAYLNRSRQPIFVSALGLSLFLITVTDCLAQSTDQLDREIFTIVEKPPEFPGGIEAMWAYLKENIQYPSAAVKAKIKGRVFVSFVIRKDGRLTDLQVMQGLGHGCDEEAIRVVKAMPLWKPGSQSGRLLLVNYTLPILFGIDYPRPKGH
ncbi:energy transducer TonB [Spirosoma fluminis]